MSYAAHLQDLESEERKAARRAKTAAILQKYKESLELEMTPEAEATARMLYESGSELMRKGKLEVGWHKSSIDSCARVTHGLCLSCGPLVMQHRPGFCDRW